MICPDFAALRKTLRAHRTPVLLLLLGCAVQAFGLFNIHAFSGVTEGGVLGATLLIAHHFGISPSVSSFVLNALCYAFGYRVLGRRFIVYSILSGIGFSLFYALFETMGLLLPEILYVYFVPLFLEGFPKLSSVKNVGAAPFSSLPRREDSCPGPPGPPTLPSTHHTTRPLLSGPEASLQDL